MIWGNSFAVFSVGPCAALLTASIGIALCPRDTDTAEMLVRCADQAMYAAKNAGKNRYAFYQTADVLPMTSPSPALPAG